MEIISKKNIKLTLTKEEVQEAIVCWLSRCKSTTETASIASVIHNDPDTKITLCKESAIIIFSEPEDKKNL